MAGMDQSDLFAYGGHARYGTGPDFDRNYHFVVHWDSFPNPPQGKTGDEEFPDMDAFVAATRVSTQARFEALEAQGAVEFVPHPGGNVTINVDPQSHVRELGAYFMRRANAGQTNALDTGHQSRYRLWMFNGCSTRDYVRSCAATRGSARATSTWCHRPATYLILREGIRPSSTAMVDSPPLRSTSAWRTRTPFEFNATARRASRQGRAAISDP